METLNLIGSIASIVSLLISIFLVTQVISIKNVIRYNADNKVRQQNNKTTGNIVGRDLKGS